MRRRHGDGVGGSIKTNFCETLLTLLFSCAHKTVQPPNNIDKLSFHARRVECNCNSVYTIFCFVHYGIRSVYIERGCGWVWRITKNRKTLMEKFLSSVAKAWTFLSVCCSFRSFFSVRKYFGGKLEMMWHSLRVWWFKRSQKLIFKLFLFHHFYSIKHFIQNIWSFPGIHFKTFFI